MTSASGYPVHPPDPGAEVAKPVAITDREGRFGNRRREPPRRRGPGARRGPAEADPQAPPDGRPPGPPSAADDEHVDYLI